jgi:crotonobetainyl-CoA:carnitine CoA-transferase CaiB-like acyl-CoA transferase
MYLGDLGAEVIKIEHVRKADGMRSLGTPHDGTGPDSGLYLAVNRNKRAMTLNIKREEGRRILLRLLEGTDVLVEGFRPGMMDTMGLGYHTLKNRFPRLVYCSISGYGASGPYKDLAGHDGNYIGYAGLLDGLGDADEAPRLPFAQIADIGGGTQPALISILAALYAREQTGTGQFLDISMTDGALSFLSIPVGERMASGESAVRRQTILSGALPNYRVYTCKDRRHVMLAALETRFFRRFLETIDRIDLLDEEDARIHSQLEAVFRSRTRTEWSGLFSDPEMCLSPVQTLEEALDDPQLNARNMVMRTQHPVYGEITTLGAPFHFSSTPCTYRLPPPTFGQHTDEILGELGFAEREISALRQEGIV